MCSTSCTGVLRAYVLGSPKMQDLTGYTKIFSKTKLTSTSTRGVLRIITLKFVTKNIQPLVASLQTSAVTDDLLSLLRKLTRFGWPLPPFLCCPIRKLMICVTEHLYP